MRYCLVLHLGESKKIRVGKLGEFVFPSGYYVYTGSAKNSINSRISRHLRKEKRKHWHIDYFLEESKVILVFITNKYGECELNEKVFEIGKGKRVAKGFGSSDCKCESHLALITDLHSLYRFFEKSGKVIFRCSKDNS